MNIENIWLDDAKTTIIVVWKVVGEGSSYNIVQISIKKVLDVKFIC